MLAGFPSVTVFDYGHIDVANEMIDLFKIVPQ